MLHPQCSMLNVQYIDTHAHLYEDDYIQDIDHVIARAREAGAVKILVPPTDVASTLKAVELCRRFPDICYPMIGLHPEDVHDNYTPDLVQLEQMLTESLDSHRFVAIGEVGLDYYWDKSHKDEQKDAFRTQIEWAVKYQLPLMIHSRNAGSDLLECLSPWRDQLTKGGVFHCFSGSIETARELLDFGPHFYIGIGGVLTFKKSKLPETVMHIPLERIVLETDSPYMAPTPMRGKRNEPTYIPYIINTLAEAKGITAEQVAEITTQNALNLFFSQKSI